MPPSSLVLRSLAATVLLLLPSAGCNRQPKADTGKTYTSDSKGPAAGGAASSGSNQPLNTPADTTNGKVSPASDAGSTSATKGQVVAGPGTPVEPASHRPHPPDPSHPQPASPPTHPPSTSH